MNKYVSCVRKHMLITYVNMLNEHALSDWPAWPLPRVPATGGEGGLGKWSLGDEAPVPDGLAAAGGGISFFAATNGAGGAGGSGGEACGAAGDRNKRARRKRARTCARTRVCACMRTQAPQASASSNEMDWPRRGLAVASAVIRCLFSASLCSMILVTTSRTRF